MKRRITVEQLQELTAEQRQRLREWWNPERGDYVLVNKESWCIYDMGCLGDRLIFDEVNWMYECREEGTKEECLPLLDIGQMIELLDEKEGGFEYFYFSEDNKEYCRLILENTNNKYIADNLCDALFEAVKQIL